MCCELCWCGGNQLSQLPVLNQAKMHRFSQRSQQSGEPGPAKQLQLAMFFFLLNSAKSFPFKSRLYSSVQNVKPHVPSYIPKHHLHVGKQTASLCIFLNMVVSGSVPREIEGFFLLRFQSVGFTLNGSGEKMVGLKLKNGPKAWRVAPEIHESVRSWVECPILVESSSKPSMQPDPLWIFVTWNSRTLA